MNKKRVNDWILIAKEAISEVGIEAGGKVDGGFRSQISSFGAAVVMGSLKAAVAFFADKGSSAVDRNKLMQAIYYVITKAETGNGVVLEPSAIMEYACRNDSFDVKEKFIDASIAIKLALNFFKLVKESDNA